MLTQNLDPVGLSDIEGGLWVTLLPFEEVRLRRGGRHPLSFVALSFIAVPCC